MKSFTKKPNFARMLMLVAFAIAALLAGCGRETPESHAAAQQTTAPGVTFHEKQGLFVPPETAKLIALQVADIEERRITGTFQFSAQVYRPASEAKFASLQPGSLGSALASGKVAGSAGAKLTENQMVPVCSGQPPTSFEARIVSLTHHLEEASGQTEVVLAIVDPHQRLAAGAFVSATVPFGDAKSIASLPRSAVLSTVEGDFVYTVSGEHFVRTSVTLGVMDAQFAEVVEGLYAGDQVVVQPVMALWMAELESLRGGKACGDGH